MSNEHFKFKNIPLKGEIMNVGWSELMDMIMLGSTSDADVTQRKGPIAK